MPPPTSSTSDSRQRASSCRNQHLCCRAWLAGSEVGHVPVLTPLCCRAPTGAQGSSGDGCELTAMWDGRQAEGAQWHSAQRQGEDREREQQLLCCIRRACGSQRRCAAPLEALLLPQACEDGQYGNGPVNNQNVEVKQKLTTNSDWRRQSGTLQALKTTTCMRHRLRKNKTKPTKTKPHNTVRTSNFSGRRGSSTPGISRCRPSRQDKHSTSSWADLPKDSTLLSTTSPARPSAWAPHHSVPAGQNGQEATERFYSTAYEV